MTALITNGTNWNVADKQGNKPLHLCSSAELMAALLQASADLNTTNKVTCRTVFCILL